MCLLQQPQRLHTPSTCSTKAAKCQVISGWTPSSHVSYDQPSSVCYCSPSSRLERCLGEGDELRPLLSQPSGWKALLVQSFRRNVASSFTRYKRFGPLLSPGRSPSLGRKAKGLYKLRSAWPTRNILCLLYSSFPGLNRGGYVVSFRLVQLPFSL